MSAHLAALPDVEGIGFASGCALWKCHPLILASSTGKGNEPWAEDQMFWLCHQQTVRQVNFIEFFMPEEETLNKELLLLVESDRYIVGNSQRIRNSGIDAFELWCWRRLFRVPWIAKRSNQSILKEISPEYSLEALLLKLQYFGHLMRRANSLEKTLMLGKIEGRRRG